MTTLDRIKELAKKRDKSLKEISLELGFSKNYLYTLKDQTPSTDKITKLADYFHVSTDYLLGRDDPEQRPVDVADKKSLLTYQGIPLSDEDRELIIRLMRGSRE
ncbi:helix-turn-helix domain-containing protein [Ligilactobacillus saerimneri]